MTQAQRRPDYGVDGYVFVVGLLAGGLVMIAVGAVVGLALGGTIARAVATIATGLGVTALVPGLLGLRYVTRGKLRHRDRLLDRIAWRGDERTLDIGTGGGLLVIGAAQRAPRGRATGIDVWDRRDLSGNTLARALSNVAIEGVAERVEILSEDARRLPFPDESFDVVVSMLCIHNIDDETGRDDALREAFRVCKRGGAILISDLANTRRYATFLCALGMTVTLSSRPLDTFPFQRVVEARKPD